MKWLLLCLVLTACGTGEVPKPVDPDVWVYGQFCDADHPCHFEEKFAGCATFTEGERKGASFCTEWCDHGQCPVGATCTEWGVCMKMCHSDKDCGEDKVCENDICVPSCKAEPKWCKSGETCQANGHCD